jgi:hypothetical protein
LLRKERYGKKYHFRIDEYNFNDFFENREEKIKRFKELEELNPNEMVKNIININIG